MPELPEVETTRRGIEPALLGRRIASVTVRNPAMRWPVPAAVQQAVGHTVTACRRRSKYILLELGESADGGLLIHLGMSGSLRVCAPDGSHTTTPTCATRSTLRPRGAGPGPRASST